MIEHIVLENHDERHAPASGPLLALAVVDDVAFLTISTYDDKESGFHATKYNHGDGIGVKLDDLMDSLALLKKSYDAKRR